MKNIFKKIILCVLSLTLVLSMTACGSGVLIDPIVFNADHENILANEDVVAAENSQYALRWDAANKRIILFDKINNVSWSSTPESALGQRFDADGFEISNHPKLDTSIMVEYIETVNFSVKVANAYTASLKKNTYSLEKVENGIKLTYYFDNLEFSIPVVYSLNDDGLGIEVLTTEITESGSNLVYRITVAPFMCSVPNVAEDSYLFYPSGSGALIYANNQDEISNTISDQVYDTDGAYYPFERIMAGYVEPIRMPVFGSKSGNRALLGIITKGAEAAYVEVDVGNSNLGYSSVFASFTLRGELPADKSLSGVQFSEQITSSPIKINYYPLYDDDANYVGMANRYRKYLIEEKGLQDFEIKNALSVSMIGGVSIPTSILGYPTTKILPTTSITATKAILNDLKTNINMPILAELFGYGKSGINIGKPAGGLGIASNIGSKKQMSDLASYCKDNDISLYFNFDMINFVSNGSGITTTTGGATTGPDHTYNRQYMYQLGSGNQTDFYYLVGRNELGGLASKAINFVADLGVEGFGSRNLTNIAYSDFCDNKYIGKGNMASDVRAILDEAHQKDLNVLGYTANDYAAVVSNAIIDVPLASAKYDLFDADIPFYQIVFKGFIPMYGASLNSVTDINSTILRSIESGSALRFTLTDIYDVDSITTEHQMFVNTVYSDVKETIINSVNETSALFNDIADAKVKTHIIVNDDVRKVVYDNGTSVYVNYGDTEFDSEFGKVAAKGYAFGKEVGTNE